MDLIQRARYDPTTYYLGRETWQCGPRYELVSYLGQGSFSRVCLARDTQTGLQARRLRFGERGSGRDEDL